MSAQVVEYFQWHTGARDRFARRQVRYAATFAKQPLPLFADGVNLFAVETLSHFSQEENRFYANR